MRDIKKFEEIANLFRGKGGNEEAESLINDCNSDKKDGYVTVWSNKSDAAKIIDRCKNDIQEIIPQGDGVQIVINRRAFRGIACAFRSNKTKNPNLT
mgnify:CR=1 FL=1